MSNIRLNLISKVKEFVARETAFNIFQLILIVLVIFSIYLPIKFDITGLFYYQLPYFSDFTRIFAYPARIFGLALFIAFMISVYGTKLFRQCLIYLVIILALFLFHHVVSPIDIFALHFNTWLRIACALLVGFYVYKSDLWLKYRDKLLWVFIILATVNAIIALVQFMTLESVGLPLLGESPLSVFGTDIAKVVAHGTVYLRGYGLFPHPNILAGVLVTTTPLILFLLNRTTQRKYRIILYSALTLIVLAIFSTLSRAGIAALFASALVYASLNWYHKIYNYRSEISISILLIVSLGIFYSWLIPRATISDQAVSERRILNITTVEIIKDNWIFGTGAGTNPIALHQKLSPYLEPWLIQPAHNYFLIIISDLGLIGAIYLAGVLYVFVAVTRVAIKKYKDKSYSINRAISLSTIAAGTFTLFWFDHYFYTVLPTQMLLGIFLGKMARIIKIASDDAKEAKLVS